MTKLLLVAALLASATAASASVVYTYHAESRSFGNTDWQFTVADYISAAGTTYITTFDSYSSFLGNPLFDVRMIDPFSANPFIATDAIGGSLSSGGWTGPFDHDGIYTATNSTLTIASSAPATSAPEPSSTALIAAGVGLLAFLQRRRRIFQQQTE